MSVPILPENAPFSNAQRAWLNGFFAGLLGMQDQASAPALGGAMLNPNDSASLSLPAADEDEEFPWHDPALPLDERLKLSAGKPLARVLMSAMAQLDCGQCGYQCKTYAEAIVSGAEKSLTKCVPGAKETARKLKELIAAKPVTVIESAASSAVQAAPASSLQEQGYTRVNPFPARLVQSLPLNQPEAEKETRFVALDLAGSGVTYEVGDSLGVYPENCAVLAEAIIAVLGAHGDETVMVPASGQSKTLREALLVDCDITKPSDELVALLRQRASRAEAECLEALLNDCGDRDVLDVLDEFPSARPTPQDLVSALAPLQPRLYSISSSRKAHPNQVHLTVAVVQYVLRERMRKGVASNFFAEQADKEKQVRVYVQPSHGFRLPKDGGAPIIMVGPGTGVAPFRAFLEERKATGAPGKNWLFFGSPRRACDFLYQNELEHYLRAGLLTRLDTAFSRDQQEKIYVQHRMLEQAKEIWSWLQEGAYLYVCGDAKRMATDVDRALHTLIMEQGGLSAEQAKAYGKELVKSGRYLKDVY